MSLPILNSSFTDWNYGSTWVNPANGTQLCDNWYSHKIGSVTFSEADFFNSVTMNPITAGSGIYQDIAINGASAINVTLEFFCAGGANNATVEIILDDGITQYSSGEFPSTSGFVNTITTKNITFNPAATSVRIYILKGATQGTLPVKFASVSASAVYTKTLTEVMTITESLYRYLNAFIRLALTDAVNGEETLVPPTGPVQTGKTVNDSLRIYEWLHKRKRNLKQGIWGN